MAHSAHERREHIAARLLSLVIAAGLLWPAWAGIEAGVRMDSPIATVLGLVLLGIAVGMARLGWQG